MLKVKIVPVFFVLVFCFLPKPVNAETPATMQACGLTLELPAAFVDVKTTGDSLRARTASLPAWNLIAYCALNEFRTDRAEAMLEEFKQSGDYLRARANLKLQGGYSATLIRRTPAAQPVQRIEAFFFSREFLYHFVLVPDESRSVTPDEWKHMQESLARTLESAQVLNQDPAITEQAYRVRLAAFAALTLAGLAGILWLLLRRVLRRRKR